MGGMLAKGTPVISLETGVTMGKIDSVFLDSDEARLVAFTFSSGGLLGGKRIHIVEIDDIHAIGPDAVTLDDARAVHDLVLMDGKCSALVELDQIVKREIITEGGVKLGHIVGLDFDPETFRLARIRVEEKDREGERVIPGSDVLNIGEEVIVVADLPTKTAAVTASDGQRLPTPMDRGRLGGDLQRAG